MFVAWLGNILGLKVVSLPLPSEHFFQSAKDVSRQETLNAIAAGVVSGAGTGSWIG